MQNSSTIEAAAPISRRESIPVPFNPGLLMGITLGGWWKILRENNFAIHPSCLFRASALSAISAVTSVCRLYERARYGRKVEQVTIKPPVFILGHWRSGTTHLHNLLSQDDRFAYPNFWQVLFPHTFLCSEWFVPKMFKPLLPKKRPFDNVALAFDLAAEDEFAICNTSFHSCSMSLVFPQREEHYDKYLTLRDVPKQDLREWKEALETFLKKLTWKFDRPIVLKSPQHTCRIRLLLEMFPDAKFVHIHRNPYTVFQSTQRMLYGWHWEYRLQNRDFEKTNERIVRQYSEMYDLFFEEKKLIPEGNFCEVGFEDLEQDPLGEVRRIYETLSLPEFGHVEPALREFTATLSDYKKNKHIEMDEELRQRLAREWRRCFEEWNYPT